MTIIDISRNLTAATAVWPGDTPFQLETILDIDQGASVNLTTIHISAHTGSHADAPYHFNRDGQTIEQVDLSKYWGLAQVVTIDKEPGPLLPEDFKAFDLTLAPRLLVRTLAGQQSFTHFPDPIPHPSPVLVEFLEAQGIILYGTDVPSMDAIDSKTLPGHKAMQRYNIAILESLDLRHPPDGLYELSALPLKIIGGDGSPVRAILRTLPHALDENATPNINIASSMKTNSRRSYWYILGAVLALGILIGSLSNWALRNSLAADVPQTVSPTIIDPTSDTAMAALPPLETATATTTPTSHPTSTATVTITAVPTETAVATKTPTATDTPAPTETPTLTPTPAKTPALTEIPDPSIPPLEATLGTIWNRPVDKMELAFVPAGSFMMGSDPNSDPQAKSNEQPQHEVFLDGFWIDKYEVNNAQYKECVDAGICTISAYAEDPLLNNDNHPVVGIDWFNAQNYCTWAGGQLPTEAQWEYAARGEDNLLYPWGGETPTCTLAQHGACGSTISVGSLSPTGDSWVGASDMAGNAWEWTANWYGIYEEGQLTDPTGPESGSMRTVRGGGWNSAADFIRTTIRFANNPFTWNNSLGLRCVVSPTK